MKKIILLTTLSICSHLFTSNQRHSQMSQNPTSDSAPLLSLEQIAHQTLIVKQTRLAIEEARLSNEGKIALRMIELREQEIKNTFCHKTTRCYYCLYSPIAYCFGSTCDICQCCE